MKFLIKLEGALSLCFIVLIIFSFDKPTVALMTILSAIIHELGHVSALFYLRETPIPKRQLNGFKIGTNLSLSYRSELLVLLSGPMANFLFALFLFPFHFTCGEYFYLFSLINLMTMITNLVPIRQYDGYKIIKCLILESSKSPYKYLRLLDFSSFIICSVLCLMTLYFILKLGAGYWIFIILIFELIKFIGEYCKNA